MRLAFRIGHPGGAPDRGWERVGAPIPSRGDVIQGSDWSTDDGGMARVPNAPRPPLIRPWLRRFSAVWLLNALIVAAAAVLYVLHASSLGAITGPHIPVWALIVMFVAGERAVVHLHF